MQYLKYFENYDEYDEYDEGLILRFYENALHHDEPETIKKVNQKYNTNFMDFLDLDDVIVYNASNILNYLLKNEPNEPYFLYRNSFDLIYFVRKILDEGRLKFAKVLYNRGHYKPYIDETLALNKLENKNIQTIEGIEIFKNLEETDISNNQITSLEPLQYLKNLKELDCGKNKITSLEPLQYLNNLETLVCLKNNISSLEPLSHLKNMKLINCNSNNITTIKPIEHLLPDINVTNFRNNPLDQESQELLKKYDLE